MRTPKDRSKEPSRQRLQAADSKQVRELTNQLRDRLLSACDGRNAIWRVAQTLHAIEVNERYIADHPREFRFEHGGLDAELV
jgi:hypothetical protein